MTPSDAKVAEFAQLFDFFEKLASRRSRKSKQDASTISEEIREAPLPKDLVPVVKRLSTIVPAARKQDAYPTTRPRRNTMASVLDRKASSMSLKLSDESSDEDEAASLAKFPLAKKYPFTFKLMLHKLYRKDDWAKAVKDMLTKSKNEYKSLAEKEQELENVVDEGGKKDEDDTGMASNGSLQFKVGPPPRSRRNSFASGVRQRSQSAVGVRRNSMMVSSPISVTPRSPVPGTAPAPDVRAVKKRCVGRRRSMSGPLNGDDASPLSNGKLKGTWVYNSAISYSERPASSRTPALLPFQPPPSPTEQLARYQQRESAHRPLSGGLDNIRVARRSSLGGAGNFTPTLMPISGVKQAKDGNLAARRRSAMLGTEGNEPSGEDKRPVKRPFSG
ncbi:hypothetical protein CVT24_007528 [Panaeolus cyanescens]|uniref:Uncharacterized protein n=1 Tax=Panaeolus cyanescens TaxID=181874 RepID=A0A409YL68_9AGAR|nr:hypothetical protein CVT24_007528 [Panaeolus cyanescens]